MLFKQWSKVQNIGPLLEVTVYQVSKQVPKEIGIFPTLASSMFMLKHAWCHDESLIGDIIPLIQLWSLIELTPIFGGKADSQLTKESSLEYSTHFWLDKYFDKEFFYAVTL